MAVGRYIITGLCAVQAGGASNSGQENLRFVKLSAICRGLRLSVLNCEKLSWELYCELVGGRYMFWTT